MPNSSVVMTHHSLYMAAIFDAIIVFCENHDVRHHNHIFMFIIFLKLWQYRDRRRPKAGTMPYSYFE